MTEEALNQFLQMARKAAEHQYKLGNQENGSYMLQASSTFAKKIIQTYHFNKPVVCIACNNTSLKASERDFIREWEVCFKCFKRASIKINKEIQKFIN